MFVIGFSSLGVWQLRRHVWREAWIAERNARIDLPSVAFDDALRDPDSFRDRRAALRGRFLRGESILVREVTPAGEEGYAIWTPLVPEGEGTPDVVMVDRGFVPAQQVAAFVEQDAAAPEPRDPAAVVGRVLVLDLQAVTPGSVETPRREWLRFDGARPDSVGALQAQLSRPLARVALEAEESPPDLLPRGGITRPESPVSHLGYAVFWFGLAVGTVVTWIALGLQLARDAERAARRASLATRPDSGQGEDG